MDNVKLIMFKSTVSGIKYIYLVMQPLQASISRTFSFSQTETLSDRLPIPPSLQPLVTRILTSVSASDYITCKWNQTVFVFL